MIEINSKNTFVGLNSLQKIIDEIQPKRIMLVTGRESFKSSGAEELLEPMLIGRTVLRHYDFRTNPDVDDLCAGARIVSDFSPNLTIAIGGGSVLDTAKLMLSLPPQIDAAKAVIRGEKSLINRSSPLVAIPTTAGSGSECTHFAVAYIGYKKFSVAHSQLLPDYVVLEPRLTWAIPAYQTAVSGLDALCQSIESFWAKSATNKSKEYASEAIRIILENFSDVVTNPNNGNRKGMLMGAHLSGKAINISKTTAPHAVSYILTKLYGIPHGHAVMLTLPQFFEYNLMENQRVDDTGVDVKLLREKLLQLIGCSTVDEGRSMLEGIMVKAGLKTRLTDLGASSKIDLNRIVESVNLERLGNNPRSLSIATLRKIIEDIW